MRSYFYDNYEHIGYFKKLTDNNNGENEDKFLFLAAVILFAGCASRQILKLSEKSNLLYLENNETLLEMRFCKLENSLDDFNKFANVVGKTEIKAAGSNAEFTPLGELMQSGDANKTMIVKNNLDTSKDAVLSNSDDIDELINTKNIKFYDIGDGMVESIVYSTSAMSVCEAFVSSKEAIKTKSVTNYFVKNGFFAAILSSDIVGNEGFVIKQTRYFFNLLSENEEKVKNDTHNPNFQKTTIESDLLKQGRILLNVLCFSKFEKAF
jgi:putative lipoprotein